MVASGAVLSTERLALAQPPVASPAHAREPKIRFRGTENPPHSLQVCGLSGYPCPKGTAVFPARASARHDCTRPRFHMPSGNIPRGACGQATLSSSCIRLTASLISIHASLAGTIQLGCFRKLKWSDFNPRALRRARQRCGYNQAVQIACDFLPILSTIAPLTGRDIQYKPKFSFCSVYSSFL